MGEEEKRGVRRRAKERQIEIEREGRPELQTDSGAGKDIVRHRASQRGRHGEKEGDNDREKNVERQRKSDREAASETKRGGHRERKRETNTGRKSQRETEGVR